MRDEEIRTGVHGQVLRSHHKDPDVLVVEELGLRHGMNRADIAVIGDKLIGYEIKGDFDSLNRLEGQVAAYSSVFDRAFIVAGPRQIYAALASVPDWWGVFVAWPTDGGGVLVDSVRVSNENPRVDPIALAQLLWKSEVVQLLSVQCDLSASELRRNRMFLYELLLETLSLSELRKNVSKHLRNRKMWRHPPRLSRDVD